MGKTVKGIEKTLKKLSMLGSEAVKGVDQITEATATEIALDARSRAPFNNGKLVQSIVPSKVRDLTYQVEVGEIYGAYVEFGTGVKVQVPNEFQDMANRIKNGNNSGTFEEGLKSIRDWCRTKGIDESAAYPIFISILNKGITPQPYFYPAFVKGREAYLKDLKALLKRLTQ